MFATILVLTALFGFLGGAGMATRPHVVFVAGDNWNGSEEIFP